MTGPEHYAQAENLLDWAREEENPAVAAVHAARAQTHAILALAAITAANTLPVGAAREGWPEVLA